MKIKYSSLLTYTSAFLLSACGGSSSDEGEESNLLTGRFIDSAVVNIEYETETQKGVTNDRGEFKFNRGEDIETISFSIGELKLPTVPTNTVITTLDLAKTTDTSDPTVVNINRLLQSLDKDSNPSNGIEITEQAKLIARQLDFSMSVTDFAVDADVINLVNNSDQISPGLVSEADATEHFESTLSDITSSYFTDTYLMTYEQYSPQTVSPCEGKVVDSHNLILTTTINNDGDLYSCSLPDKPQISCIVNDLDNNGMYYSFGTNTENTITGLQLLFENDTLSGKWVINIPEDIGGGTTDCGIVTGVKL